MLTLNQTGALLGAFQQAPTTDVNDLIIGNTGNITQAALTPAQPAELNNNQSNALRNLQQFIDENVQDEDTADLLQQQLEAVEQMMQAFNEDSSVPDPVFALLAANPNSLSELPAGSIVNGLF